jgi:hypothetical protein
MRRDRIGVMPVLGRPGLRFGASVESFFFFFPIRLSVRLVKSLCQDSGLEYRSRRALAVVFVLTLFTLADKV